MSDAVFLQLNTPRKKKYTKTPRPQHTRKPTTTNTEFKKGLDELKAKILKRRNSRTKQEPLDMSIPVIEEETNEINHKLSNLNKKIEQHNIQHKAVEKIKTETNTTESKIPKKKLVRTKTISNLSRKAVTFRTPRKTIKERS